MSLMAKKLFYIGLTLSFYAVSATALILGIGGGGGLILIIGCGIHLASSMTIVDEIINDAHECMKGNPIEKLPPNHSVPEFLRMSEEEEPKVT